jgi:predicted 3-demethylubiquinone-9 3-methyltransferase (glyoxalase superfamily)
LKPFIALNCGPVFKFNEALSFVVDYRTQKEVDSLWSRFTAGGEEVQCGRLKDTFGVSWQIVPTAMDKMLREPDSVKADRVRTRAAGFPSGDGLFPMPMQTWDGS